MIELRNISKSFNRKSSSPINALNDVTLSIPQNKFVVIVGSNGSGKSTLLNILAGTILPDAGQIFINGNDVTRMRDYDRSKWVARIFQDPLLGTSPDLTVIENFRLASLRTENKKLRNGLSDKFRKLVREKVYTLGLGLEDKLDQRIGSLSGGQRQALTLMMSVMPVFHVGMVSESGYPEILLLDEPTASLDPKTAESILKIADRIIRSHNLTVIFVTHQIKDALQYGNRIISMSNGQVAKDLADEEKNKLELTDVLQWFN